MQVIYDFATDVRPWLFPLPALVVPIFGYFILGKSPEPRRRNFFSVICWGAALWFFCAFLGRLQDYISFKHAIADGSAQVTEGLVSHFIPMQNSVNFKQHESFVVNGVPFNYWSPLITGGFNQPGVIHDNMYVRLTSKDGIILKVETK